jgi:hypothetical protein
VGLDEISREQVVSPLIAGVRRRGLGGEVVEEAQGGI